MEPARRGRRLAVGVPLVASLLALAVRAADLPVDAQEVFERYSPRVVQVQVVEASSGAKSGIGSGFVVSETGHVVTNFHVVSGLVHHPERYRGEIVDPEGRTGSLEILALDVVHDLAVVRTDLSFESHFELGTSKLPKGVRLYSLGNPYDLGLSIVEGTYNGLLEHSRFERMHFTGSLNPGMSGGPAILADGTVAGVNVATAGNQVSFLVPAERVTELLASAFAPSFEPVEDFTEALRVQLLEYQETYLADVLQDPVETVHLGPFEVPSEPAPFFNCWGNTLHEEDDLYEALVHQCFTEDGVYVSERHDFSILSLRHRQLGTDELGTSRFYELYSWFFESNHSEMDGSKEDFTPFRCEVGFVESGGLVFKTAFCLRGYRKLAGLYDAIFKAAALGHDRTGLETALVMSGVSFENAARLARRYLESISWSE